ncbi:cupin domain-containing protein [Nocardia sp. NPDC004604]|uniref:cupin domain-containing protein n=1 Tax=Nocardia sp. NPDC004604 TaxID=3157013 RepID=UPI0033B32CF7
MLRLTEYPEWVHLLPKVDLPPWLTGCAHVIDGEDGRTILHSSPDGANVPAHKHGAQLFIVVAGSVKVTIDGEVKDLVAGDSVEIADQQEHAVVAEPNSLVIEVFADSATSPEAQVTMSAETLAALREQMARSQS